MYLHLAWNNPAPWDYIVWQLVRATGWTLDYAESLPLTRIHEWLQIIEAENRASQTLSARRGKR